MAAIGIRFTTFCAVFVILVAAASAAQSAPAPAVDCTSLVLNMADCLSFVSAGSTTTKPEGSCCSGLKTVLKANADCLCQAFRNSAQLGVTLNVTKSLSLPAACHVSAPSVTNCGMIDGTGDAPALSPLAVSPSGTTVAGTPIPVTDGAPTPAPGGSATGASSRASAMGTSAVVMVATTLSFAYSF